MERMGSFWRGEIKQSSSCIRNRRRKEIRKRRIRKKSKVSELLKSMEKKGVVSIEGNGRGTKYRISAGPRVGTAPNEAGGNTLIIE